MATPLNGVTYTVKLKSNGQVISTQQTDVTGKISLNLSPEEYVVEITIPAGYSLSNSVLTEQGASPVNEATTIINDVTITEGGITTIVTNFLAE